MDECFKLVKEKVKEAPGSTAIKKKEWIDGPTWDKIRLGATQRRIMNKLWRRFGKCQKTWAWSRWTQVLNTARTGQSVVNLRPETFVENSLKRSELAHFAWHLARVACRLNARQVQKMVRRDKLAWLTSKTEELAQLCQDGTSSEIHRQVKNCLIKITPNAIATRRAPLKDADGRMYVTEDSKYLLWQQHWSQLYGGSIRNTVSNFRSTIWPPTGVSEQPTTQDSSTCEDSDTRGAVRDSDLFTPAEIRRALRHQMNGKASADGVPSREL
eukprot:6477957-Amphidinium_carterae.1